MCFMFPGEGLLKEPLQRNSHAIVNVGFVSFQMSIIREATAYKGIGNMAKKMCVSIRLSNFLKTDFKWGRR